jgi:hypothetical protein
MALGIAAILGQGINPCLSRDLLEKRVRPNGYEPQARLGTVLPYAVSRVETFAGAFTEKEKRALLQTRLQIDAVDPDLDIALGRRITLARSLVSQALHQMPREAERE